MNPFRRISLGLVLGLVVCAIPALIWLVLAPLPERFSSFSIALLSIGQLCGLAGLGLFTLTMLLSARLKFLEPFFDGLNRMYINHHTLGSLTLILLLAHPMFLAGQYATFSMRQAARFLLPQYQTFEVLLGMLALLLLILILILTIFWRPAYHIWKWMHRFLGVVYLIAVLHVLLVESDVSGSMMLKVYVVVISLLALAAYTYRSVFGHKLVRRYPFTLTAITPLSPLVTQLELQPQSQPSFAHLPGQFVFLKLANGTSLSPEEHPFSITSKPGSSSLTLAVKNLGDYTKKIQTLSPPIQTWVEGPFGIFSYHTFPARRYIWIAGGIGITPFVSMARDYYQSQRTEPVLLLYSVRSSDEAVFWDELQTIVKERPNFNATLFDASRGMRITPEIIKEMHVNDFTDTQIFICGPVSMMRDLREGLQKSGVAPEKIHTEEFSL